MEFNFDIIWRDQKIGRIEKGNPDMWYLEGIWVSDNTSASKDFEKLVQTFDYKKIMRYPEKGTRIILIDKANREETHASVLSISKGCLLVRRVYENLLVKWLLENVK